MTTGAMNRRNRPVRLGAGFATGVARGGGTDGKPAAVAGTPGETDGAVIARDTGAVTA